MTVEIVELELEVLQSIKVLNEIYVAKGAGLALAGKDDFVLFIFV